MKGMNTVMKSEVVGLVLCLWMFCVQSAFSQTHFVPGELMVLIHPQSSIDDWCEDLEESGLSEVGPVQRLSQSLNLWRIRYDAQLDAELATRLAGAHPHTVLVQVNHTNLVLRSEPNDPGFNQQWSLYNDGTNGGSGLSDIAAVDAWDKVTGGVTALGDTIVVAVIDGGFSIDHEDLAPNIFVNRNEVPGNGVDDDQNGYIDDVSGWNVYTNSGTPSFSNHGTHVAGIIGAKGNNDQGIAGVNWNVKLLPISGSSTLESTVVAAYAYALDMRRLFNQSGGQKGAFVVAGNSSFGVDYGDPTEYPIWCAMFDSMGVAGILHTGATANLNIDVDVALDVPTACGSNFLIAVTNTTSSDTKNAGAAYGVNSIDLGAPGTNIYSTTVSGYGNMTGTSMATPHVAGAIALMYNAICSDVFDSYSGNPGGLALYVRNKLLSEGVDQVSALDGLVSTGGRLNVNKAILSVIDSCVTIQFSVDASTCDSCDGTIDAYVFGGVPPYSYQWSTGATSASIGNACAGIYSLTVTDALGQQYQSISAVSDSNGPEVGFEVEAVSCFSGADGSIALIGASHYLWSDGDTSDFRSNLQAGNYFIHATDSNAACTTMVSVAVGSPMALGVSFYKEIPVPYHTASGQLAVRPFGGTPPYQVLWSQGSTDTLRSNLSVGSYTLSIVDAHGCQLDTSVYLGYPVGLDEEGGSTIRVYPNPSHDKVMVSSNVGKWTEVSLLDAMGRELHVPFKQNGFLLELTVVDLPRGTYVLLLRSELEVHTKRIIVEQP
jgi:subtilisin family serine protease